MSLEALCEVSPDLPNTDEKKLRRHRDFEVRRCDGPGVGWALMGNANLPHEYLFAFARIDHAILSRGEGELRQPTEEMG